MNKYVVVAGSIGAGKSTLVKMIAERLDWYPIFEPVGENPYLEDFYRDMPAWAFHSQIYFLTNRLRTYAKLFDQGKSVIQDRSVYEDAEVFARNLYQTNMIAERDYQTYKDLYEVVTDFLPQPDLVVYLRASVHTLTHRIEQRNRFFERKISETYLSQLNNLYEDWMGHFALCPVLTVPSDDLDYVTDPRHLDLVITKIVEKLTGKEEVVFGFDEVNGFA